MPPPPPPQPPSPPPTPLKEEVNSWPAWLIYYSVRPVLYENWRK